MFYLFLAYRMYTIHTKGTDPERIGYPDSTDINEILKLEIDDYILRFKNNQWTNDKMARKISISFNMLLIASSMIIFLLFLYFLLLLFLDH